MASDDLREQLALVEAQLFASTDLSVIRAIDASTDVPDAIERLQHVGMTAAQAALVLNMPLRARTQIERNTLFAEAERLRRLL